MPSPAMTAPTRSPKACCRRRRRRHVSADRQQLHAGRGGRVADGRDERGSSVHPEVPVPRGAVRGIRALARSVARRRGRLRLRMFNVRGVWAGDSHEARATTKTHQWYGEVMLGRPLAPMEMVRAPDIKVLA